MNNMWWQMFFVGIALLFVFEGILPFLYPRLWRRAVYQMLTQTDNVLRAIGLFSMLAGLIVLYVIREWS
ncbi:MAG: hypothetical protein A3J38_04085 [Gammaproteobacteria bacterium RIFCSPHIGHO2_12_FULL_45_9]|nr:MAG: hypothetical protein A3J38_04085 [Gammaproteobacteria bacterium RIFCSPHIGHO2_12_FULL_45_9]